MRALLDTRSGRDPAVVIWAAAGTCWAVMAALVLAGASGFCHDGVAPDGTSEPPGTVFAVWLVMIGAMMLPTTVPLARMFVVVTARAPRPTGTRVAFLAGYLALWSGFAAAALLGDRAVDALLGRAAPSGLVLGAVLVVAGVFQLTPWKNHCLTVCRSPWMFLWQYYGRGVRGAWMLGVRHGAFCLGCCWALMLVMLGTGVSSIRWMLALTGAMLLEKTAPKGSRLAVPLGGALILAGAAVFLPAVGAFPADLAGSAARPGGGRGRREGRPGGGGGQPGDSLAGAGAGPTAARGPHRFPTGPPACSNQQFLRHGLRRGVDGDARSNELRVRVARQAGPNRLRGPS